MKRPARGGLYRLVTQFYDGGADAFDPDRFIREAVEEDDLIAAATIALESYGWELYGFIARQVQAEEVDEVFTRVADELVRGLPQLVSRERVRDWIYTIVHGAWIRTQAGDPAKPLDAHPQFAGWVHDLIAGFRAAHGPRRSSPERPPRRTSPELREHAVPSSGTPVATATTGLPRQLHAMLFGRTVTRIGMERIAMSRLR